MTLREHEVATQLRTELLRAQSLEYALSLLEDQKKDLYTTRAQERDRIGRVLAAQIPVPPELALTKAQQQLLRLPQTALNEKEKAEVIALISQLQRLRSGGCYNLSAEQEQTLKFEDRLFSFHIPHIPYTFCIDVVIPLLHGLTNEELGIVNIFIDNASGTRYEYPLDEETSRRYFQKVRLLDGGNPENFPKLKFPKIEETLSEISSLLK